VKRAQGSVSLDSAKRNGRESSKAALLPHRWQPGESGNPLGLSRAQRVALAAARDTIASAEPRAAEVLIEAMELAASKRDAALMVRAAQAVLATGMELRDRTAKGDGAIDVTPGRVSDATLRELLSKALELQRLAEPARESADAIAQATDSTAGTAGGSARVSAHEAPGTKPLTDAELDALASLP
jgi:hypothetical protein